jgi:hypothetical protein
MPRDSLTEFTDGYIECAALWPINDHSYKDEFNAWTREAMHPDAIKLMQAECKNFFELMEKHILCDDGPTGEDGSSQARMAGHDFWLTRNYHGAGFWDGDWPREEGGVLSACCRVFGPCELEVGDDNMLHVHSTDK